MYTLLNNPSAISLTGYKNLNLDYAREILTMGADRWIEYRRENPATVESDHLLVRLLQNLNIAYNGSLEQYRNMVELRTNQLAGVLGLTSSFYKGRLHKGVFYGDDVHEAILLVDEDFPLAEASGQWQDWEPIRILSHPRSDLGIETLDGKCRTSESGYAVIAINVPMLACQYQLWQRSEYAGTDEVYKRTLGQFLMTYPLTNALRSHLDVAVFNRLSRMWFRKPMGQNYRKPPFHITDVSARLDNQLKDILDRLTKQAYHFQTMLEIIPGAYREQSLAVHKLPNVIQANQTLWVLYLARLNLMSFLVSFSRLNGNEKNRPEFIKIKRSLIEEQSSKYMSNSQPSHLSNYFREEVSENIMPYL